MKFSPFKSSQTLTEATEERGIRQITRLERIIDMLFALIIFNLFTFLPTPELDNIDKGTLQEVLIEHRKRANYVALKFT